MPPHQGNVYVDGFPICDDGWGHEEARVTCRCHKYFYKSKHLKACLRCVYFFQILYLYIQICILFSILSQIHPQISNRMLGYSFGIADIKSTYGNAERGEQFWRSS